MRFPAQTFPHEGFIVNSLGHLNLDGYDLVTLAEKFDTPLYIVSEERLKQNSHRILNAFKRYYKGETKVAYAVKANYTLAVVKIFIKEGLWAEVFSGPELHIALLAGADPSKIVLTGHNRVEKDFKEAMEVGVALIVVDSASELRRLDKAAGEVGVEAKVLIRVNPEVTVPTHPRIATGVKGAKFGVDIPSGMAYKTCEEALHMDWVRVAGVHTHIGSQVLTVEPFLEAAEKIMDFVSGLNAKFGFKPEYLDFGGGFGIPYKPQERTEQLNFEALAEAMSTVVEQASKKVEMKPPTLVFEPGRSLVADAEILLSRVGNLKKTPIGKYVCLDASTNMVFPVLLTDQYFEFLVVNKADKKPEETVNFVGPLCFTGDVLGMGRRVPRIDAGDLVVILNVGAYCKSAASTHNAEPRPATVLLSKDGVELVQRRENLNDIIARDMVPPRLYKK